MGLDFRLEVGMPAFTNFILCTAWGGEAISLENFLIAARSSRKNTIVAEGVSALCKCGFACAQDMCSSANLLST